MTVRELIEHLQTLPQDAECTIDVPFDDNGPVTSRKLTQRDVFETSEGDVWFDWASPEPREENV